MTLGNPAVTFDDPRALAANLLRDALAARNISGDVGTAIPTGKTLETFELPYALVADDGTPRMQYPVIAYPVIRVTVFADDEDDAYDLASSCSALLATGHHGQLAGCVPLTGPLRAVDPETQLPIASITLRGRVVGRAL